MIRTAEVTVLATLVEAHDEDTGEMHTALMLSTVEGLPLVLMDTRGDENAQVAIRLIEMMLEDDE